MTHEVDITRPYALTYALPGLRINLHDKQEVMQFSLAGAHAVADLHRRLFGTRMQVRLYRPTLQPYTPWDEVEDEG